MVRTAMLMVVGAVVMAEDDDHDHAHICIGEIESKDEACAEYTDKEACESAFKSPFSDGLCDWVPAMCIGEIESKNEDCAEYDDKEACEKAFKSPFSDGLCDWVAVDCDSAEAKDCMSRCAGCADSDDPVKCPEGCGACGGYRSCIDHDSSEHDDSSEDSADACGTYADCGSCLDDNTCMYEKTEKKCVFGETASMMGDYAFSKDACPAEPKCDTYMDCGSCLDDITCMYEKTEKKCVFGETASMTGDYAFTKAACPVEPKCEDYMDCDTCMDDMACLYEKTEMKCVTSETAPISGDYIFLKASCPPKSRSGGPTGVDFCEREEMTKEMCEASSCCNYGEHRTDVTKCQSDIGRAECTDLPDKTPVVPCVDLTKSGECGPREDCKWLKQQKRCIDASSCEAQSKKDCKERPDCEYNRVQTTCYDLGTIPCNEYIKGIECKAAEPLGLELTCFFDKVTKKCRDRACEDLKGGGVCNKYSSCSYDFTARKCNTKA